MSSFTNTSTPLDNLLTMFEEEFQKFTGSLDDYDKYDEKITNLEKFKKFLAEFVKTHFSENLIEFQKQETFLTKIYGDNFENLEDERIIEIINSVKMDSKFADIKAQIQALSDLLMLTMEGGEGRISKLMSIINHKLSDAGKKIVNSVRTFMGYAALPPSIHTSVELAEEMSDGDIIRAVLSLEHDPNDHSVLYSPGLTLPTDPSTQEDPNPGQYLIKEVKKIMYQKVKLREAIVEQKISATILNDFIVNRNTLTGELETYGKIYTSETKEYDTLVINNLITHFIRKSSRVTRNSVKEVKNLINTLEVKLRNPISEKHTIIIEAIEELKKKISEAENYVSPAGKTFIVQRIFSKSNGLLKKFVDGPLKDFMITLKVEQKTRDRLIEISTELLDNRDALKKLLESSKLFEDIGGLGLDENEQDELKETFITLLLNTEPENIVNAMPNQVEVVDNTLEFNPNVFNMPAQNPNRKRRHPNSGLNNNLGVQNNNLGVQNNNLGGKRKKTAKKNNKKSKATKKMKKIKKTMKRKTGKKAKKTSRRRR